MFRALEKFVESQSWLDTLGEPLQQTIHSLLTSSEMGKQVKNLLNGTWLGHPAHPMLTDVPVGAWTATLALDSISAMSGDEGLQTAADVTLATGWLAAGGAALTGFTDWSDTFGMERKLGLLHGLTMVSSYLCYSLSLLARLNGSRSTGVALANTGYALMATGAYLGGDQVFDLGYGVNHTAFIHGPGEFTPVMPEAELQADSPTKGDAGGVAVMLVKQGNEIYALDDTCVHAGCSLSGGHLAGASIICPCHGSQFALRDGSIINGPATMPEPHYEVRVQDGMVEVKQAS